MYGHSRGRRRGRGMVPSGVEASCRALKRRLFDRPKMFRQTSRVVALGVLVGVAVVVSPAVASSSSQWTIQYTPSPATASVFHGVSCASASVCTAVGSTTGVSGSGGLVAEVWQSGVWSLEKPTGSDVGVFNGVSCISASACTAVGFGRSGYLIEVRDGTTWIRQDTQNAEGTVGSLYGVSCTSSISCVAVGTTSEIWDGNNWTEERIPYPKGRGQLNAVSCTAPDACVAVGETAAGKPYAASWNGTVWITESIVIPKGYGYFTGVSCTSSAACVAVGEVQSNSFSETWNGAVWSIQDVPGDYSFLNAVSCTSASACVAVGWWEVGTVYEPLAETWDGSRWTIQKDSGLSRKGGFNGVSCAFSSACMGAGNIVEGWDGTNWEIQATAKPHGGLLAGVSCSSPSACTAVGDSGFSKPFAERWNGTTWTIQQVANPGWAADWGFLFVAEFMFCRRAYSWLHPSALRRDLERYNVDSQPDSTPSKRGSWIPKRCIVRLGECLHDRWIFQQSS